MKVIVQEYKVDVKGIGTFSIMSGDNDITLPTFGFDKNGEVMSRREATIDGYAPLQREWVNKMIENAIESFKNYATENDDMDFKTVYVFVFSRSDCPNQIGIATNDIPFKVVDSSFTFTESKII